MRREWRYVAGAMIVGFAVYYFSVQLSGHWSELFSWRHRINLFAFAFSMQLLVVYHVVLAWLFKCWLGLLKADLAWAKSFKVLYVSQMARFLPGGVWGYVGQVYLGSQEGIRREKLILASAGHLVLNLIAGTALAALFTLRREGTGMGWTAPFVLIGAVLAAVLIPQGLRLWDARLCRGEGDTYGKCIGSISLFGFSLLYVVHWFLYGLAFWLFLVSLQVADRLTFGEALGALACAGVSGFIIPFVPGGLGVREGVLAFLLRPYLGASDAAVVSLLSRVWLLLVDLLCFGLALCLDPGISRLRSWRRLPPSASVQYKST